ncbi:AAA family ATPase [Klebsiella sp. Q11]|uniref:AAA family ATPase n=1 Tax=Klebsiella sp. Q11 TaxID=857461 RepID=UPI0035686C5B
MFTQLKIENFKAFSCKQEIEFAPITLIFGQNSSGKSSIIQSILALKQTLLNSTSNASLITCGTCIDLGGYLSAVNSHDPAKEIQLEFSFVNNLPSKEYNDEFLEYPVFAVTDIRNVGLSYSYSKDFGTRDSFLNKFSYFVQTPGTRHKKIELNIKKGVSGYTKTLDETYYGDHETFKSFYSFITRVNNKAIGKDLEPINRVIYEALETGVYKVRKDIAIPLMLSGNVMVNIPNGYLQRISEEIKYEFNQVKYLGPLRTHPKRFYQAGKDIVSKTKGETNLGGELFEAGEEVITEINKWLDSFEISYDINVENLGNETTGDVISVILNDKRSNTLVTPADVGFGIGQVMPIITEAIASKNTTICVEQPEIHLHPRLQAHLADLFIDSVNPNGKNNQWIIETHSESLMLRIQKRIREKKIDYRMVKVFYVIPDCDGSQIMELPLDSDGDFTVHWPEGFFDERLNDIFGA